MADTTDNPLFDEFAILLQQTFDLAATPVSVKGMFVLEFEHRHTLCFEFNKSLNEVALWAKLAHQPDIQKINTLFLQANAFGRGTAGAYFSFDHQNSEMLLERHFYAPLPSPEVFTLMLENFIEALVTWEERIIQLEAQMPKIDASEEQSHCLEQFIKV